MTEANQKSSERKGYAKYAIWMSLATIIAAMDQLTKWAIIKWVPLYDKIPVNSFINITHLVTTIPEDKPSEEDLFGNHWAKFGK